MNKDNYIRLLEIENMDQQLFLQTAKNENTRMQSKIAEWIEDLKNGGIERKNLAAQNNALQNELNQARKESDTDKASIDALLKKVTCLQNQNENLIEDLETSQKRVRGLRNELEQADQEMKRIPMLCENIKVFTNHNEELHTKLTLAGARLEESMAENTRLRSVTSDLEILNYDMGMELEKLKKEKENLQLEFYRLKPPAPVSVKEERK